MSARRSRDNREATDEPFILSRMYLLSPQVKEKFLKDFESNFSQQLDSWSETFYDTVHSSLTNAECILKKDSYAAKYWKLFCFARNNIMEITTDEGDIKEPLARLLNFKSEDLITTQLLKPFCTIWNEKCVYMVDGCAVELTTTNYGFVCCSLKRFCLGVNRTNFALAELQKVAKKIGLDNLAMYEPINYILDKK